MEHVVLSLNSQLETVLQR